MHGPENLPVFIGHENVNRKVIQCVSLARDVQGNCLEWLLRLLVEDKILEARVFAREVLQLSILVASLSCHHKAR